MLIKQKTLMEVSSIIVSFFSPLFNRFHLGLKPSIENSITNIFSQFDANVTIPCILRQGFPKPVIYWFVFKSIIHCFYC